MHGTNVREKKEKRRKREKKRGVVSTVTLKTFTSSYTAFSDIYSADTGCPFSVYLPTLRH